MKEELVLLCLIPCPVSARLNHRVDPPPRPHIGWFWADPPGPALHCRVMVSHDHVMVVTWHDGRRRSAFTLMKRTCQVLEETKRIQLGYQEWWPWSEFMHKRKIGTKCHKYFGKIPKNKVWQRRSKVSQPSHGNTLGCSRTIYTSWLHLVEKDKQGVNLTGVPSRGSPWSWALVPVKLYRLDVKWSFDSLPLWNCASESWWHCNKTNVKLHYHMGEGNTENPIGLGIFALHSAKGASRSCAVLL